MLTDAPVTDAPEARPQKAQEFRDEGVVSVEPQVRKALTRLAPAPAARWRILAYKWFVLIRRTG